jgi:hypothetical protein
VRAEARFSKMRAVTNGALERARWKGSPRDPRGAGPEDRGSARSRKRRRCEPEGAAGTA